VSVTEPEWGIDSISRGARRYANHLGETIFDALDEAAPEDRNRIVALLAARVMTAADT
jgi:hypothetical protein